MIIINIVIPSACMDWICVDCEEDGPGTGCPVVEEPSGSE